MFCFPLLLLQRLPFTLGFISSMAGTIYVSMVLHSYLLSVLFSVVQVILRFLVMFPNYGSLFYAIKFTIHLDIFKLIPLTVLGTCTFILCDILLPWRINWHEVSLFQPHLISTKMFWKLTMITIYTVAPAHFPLTWFYY